MSPVPDPSHSMVQLLAVVEVDHEQRVRCENPGCGHAVHKAIHVVQEGTQLLVLGSTCFNRRYGTASLGAPRYSEGSSRMLSAEERDLLLSNTAALLEQFAREHEASLRRRQEKSVLLPAQPHALRRSQSEPRLLTRANTPLSKWSTATTSYAKRVVPWQWMRPGTSMAGFKLSDGTAWVRVQHQDGRQMLAPWPPFEAWDEWLPAHLGSPEQGLGAYALTDLPAAISFLRSLRERERVSGFWTEIERVLSSDDEGGARTARVDF